MDITKENNYLVLKIPLRSKGEFTYGDGTYEVDNLVGIDNGDLDYTISQMNYLDYKDDYQESMPIIHFCDKEEFEKVCKDFNLQIWKHKKCAKCRQVIYGASTIKNEKTICLSCE
jgi:hypothetical protein